MDSPMNALEAIRTRCSVRRYTDRPVTDEQLHMLLDAAFCAPSACNKRPWEFIVVRDRTILDTFADRLRFQRMLHEAPLAIVICGDEGRMSNHDLLLNDCSAAAQNILLAAHCVGMGACWCGLALKTAQKLVRTQLGLPEHIYPVATIAVGWPDERHEQSGRYDARRIHLERFGS